jgi:hypothetical protein
MILAVLALFVATSPPRSSAEAERQAKAIMDAAERAADEVAGAADKVLVLDTANQLLGRLTGKDAATMAALTLPQGAVTVIAPGADGRPVVHHFTWPDFFAHLPKDKPVVEEQLRDPLVRIDGDVAMVWSRYDLTVDGKFLHCGTDHFDLIRVDGRWRILNVTSNQRKEDCGR